MRVYISGPVSGRENGNEEAFRECAEALRVLGYDPVVPHDIVPEGCTWQEAMRHCLVWLPTCDAVCFLQGWRTSAGAKVERAVAKACGLAIGDGPRAVRLARARLASQSAAEGKRACMYVRYVDDEPAGVYETIEDLCEATGYSRKYAQWLCTPSAKRLPSCIERVWL